MGSASSLPEGCIELTMRDPVKLKERGFTPAGTRLWRIPDGYTMVRDSSSINEEYVLYEGDTPKYHYQVTQWKVTDGVRREHRVLDLHEITDVTQYEERHTVGMRPVAPLL